MSLDRHAVVRALLEQGALAVQDHLARDFAPEGGSGPGLHLLRRTFFPDLVVDVEEVFDAPGDRVVARYAVRTDATGTAATWSGVAFVRFRGDEIAGARTIQDTLPIMQALGVAPDDAEIERRMDALLE